MPCGDRMQHPGADFSLTDQFIVLQPSLQFIWKHSSRDLSPLINKAKMAWLLPSVLLGEWATVGKMLLTSLSEMAAFEGKLFLCSWPLLWSPGCHVIQANAVQGSLLEGCSGLQQLATGSPAPFQSWLNISIAEFAQVVMHTLSTGNVLVRRRKQILDFN